MQSKYCYTTQPSCDLLCGFNMLMKQVIASEWANENRWTADSGLIASCH